MKLDYVEPFIRMAINMNENNEDIKKEWRKYLLHCCNTRIFKGASWQHKNRRRKPFKSHDTTIFSYTRTIKTEF